ncbi:MAG: hypothetical protein EXR72_22245, partial [Myxococcales bacterium]|nr:hypothetical protein [Myxococcales bacterium]
MSALDLRLHDAAGAWGAAFSPAEALGLFGLAPDEPFGRDWQSLGSPVGLGQGALERNPPRVGVAAEATRCAFTGVEGAQARDGSGVECFALLSSGWVFPSHVGKPHHNASVMRKAFVDVLKEMGLDRKFSSHGLRRTANDL